MCRATNDTNLCLVKLNLRLSIQTNKPADSDNLVVQFRHFYFKVWPTGIDSKQIATRVASKILFLRRALNFACGPRPDAPRACLSPIVQCAFKVTRRPLIVVMQRAAINTRGPLEKGRYLPFIKAHVGGSTAFRLVGLEACDRNVLNVLILGSAPHEQYPQTQGQVPTLHCHTALLASPGCLYEICGWV